MSSIGQYLFSVLTAALMTAVVCIVISDKSPLGATLKITCGVFLAITAVSPLLDIQMIDLSEYLSSVSADTQLITQAGVEAGLNNQKTIINESISAYVLEKANALSLDLTAKVEFSDDPIPVPHKIYLDGVASPYAREELTQYIAEYIGISEEHQIWN